MYSSKAVYSYFLSLAISSSAYPQFRNQRPHTKKKPYLKDQMKQPLAHEILNNADTVHCQTCKYNSREILPKNLQNCDNRLNLREKFYTITATFYTSTARSACDILHVCLLATVYGLLSTVYGLLSIIYCLLSVLWCLLLY